MSNTPGERANWKIPIDVKTLTCKTITLLMEANDTVQSVKAKLQKLYCHSSAPGQQTLISGGKKLSDVRRLMDYNIDGGSILHLLLKLGGPLPITEEVRIFKIDTKEEIRFDVEPDDTILNIKLAIQEREGISIEFQRLIWHGRNLADQKQLSDLVLRRTGNNTIFLLIRKARKVTQIAPRFNLDVSGESHDELLNIQEYMINTVRDAEDGRITVAELGSRIHHKFKSLKKRRYYMSSRKATFTDFVASCPKVVVLEDVMDIQQRYVQYSGIDEEKGDKKCENEEEKKSLLMEIRDMKQMNNRWIQELKTQEGIIKRMGTKQNDLAMENDKLKQQLQSLKDYTQNIDALNNEQLDELKKKFRNKIEEIEQAKVRLLEVELYCVVCLDNRKNILIQGCNHIVICSECEAKLEVKRCPQCQAPYQNTLRINI